MIDISRELLTVLMLGGFLLGVLTGFPLAFVTGGLALLGGLMKFGPAVADLLYQRAASGALLNYTLLAVPMFTFMGLVLEKSRLGERLFDVLYLWFGGIKGGLAVVTIALGTVIAATVGVVAASVTMLAVMALPPMIRRGYDRSLACGAVCAGGCLGILIPPSIMLVLYGPMAQLSVGKLFFAAFMPGFLLSGLYIAYIIVYSYVRPNAAPSVSIEQRAMPLIAKIRMLVTGLLPTIVLIMSVLGAIFFGVATPTEASGAGALAAVILATAYRQFSWAKLWDTAIETVRICGFIFLIVVMAFAFVGVFLGAGCGRVVESVLLAVPGGKWGAFFAIMIVCFLLGFFIDWLGIVFILVPIVTPIGAAFGFDPLWFGMMICVNLQMSFMTPPFAWAIFFLKGTAPPEFNIQLREIIRGVIPYVILIVVALVLCIIFPQIILWLPNQMLG